MRGCKLNKELTVKGLRIGKPNPVRIMGVINLSPESFYSGSVVTSNQDLARRIGEMIEQGADIIDIGGASTAPFEVYGTGRITMNDELARISSALKTIIDCTDLPISIDTASSKVAELALDKGVSIVNDVSGLRGDRNMAALIAERLVPLVIMANCPQGCNSIDSSIDALRNSIQIAKNAGIEENQLILDPGIGFGKPPEVDYEILKRLEIFSAFGRPLLVGVSRKAFIGHILSEENPEDRLYGSIAATAVAVVNGADLIRTHDVKETLAAARVGEILR
ncbi:MAG: dihydropteroate synthase [Candidatus Thorarchaeota archaeon]